MFELGNHRSKDNQFIKGIIFSLATIVHFNHYQIIPNNIYEYFIDLGF